MNTLEGLRDARALIANPEHWTKGCLARDGRGFPVPTRDSEAIKFCALGAICRAAGSPISPLIFAIETAAEKIYSMCIMNVNDVMGHEATIKVFDEAIRNEQQREA